MPRLIDPTQGQVLVEDQDVTAMGPRALRGLRRHKLSMVFQHFGLFPHRRIIDNVAYGLEVQGMKRAERYAKARAVLDMVNLADWENYYPGQLSGGMQQRVGLARALAVDPEILLFDEPFSALDPLIRREMQDELIALQQRMHKTMLFITHDFNEAIKLGDRIALMRDGEFVQVGTAEEVVLMPANRLCGRIYQGCAEGQGVDGAHDYAAGGDPSGQHGGRRARRPGDGTSRRSHPDSGAFGRAAAGDRRASTRDRQHRPDDRDVGPEPGCERCARGGGAGMTTIARRLAGKTMRQHPAWHYLLAAGLYMVFLLLLGALALDLRTFPVAWNLHLRTPVDALASWVIGHRMHHPLFLYGFEPLSNAIDGALRAVEALLLGLPWPACMVAVAFIGYRAGGRRLAIFGVLALFFAAATGLWEASVQTLALMGVSVLLSLAAGIPLGIVAATYPRFERALRPLLDAMQTHARLCLSDSRCCSSLAWRVCPAWWRR